MFSRGVAFFAVLMSGGCEGRDRGIFDLVNLPSGADLVQAQAWKAWEAAGVLCVDQL